MASIKLKVLKEQLKDTLAKGFIHPNVFSVRCFYFFMQEGGWFPLGKNRLSVGK